MKTPILPTRSFFKFCPSPSHFLVISSPTPTVLSVVLFLWLSRWSHIWWAVLLNDDMDLHMLSLGTLLPEGPWCVFYATSKGSSLLRSDMWCGFLLVLWFDITHKQTDKHTAHSRASRLTHSYIIYLQHLLCAHSSYLYYIRWLNE